jgi:hypothetical protein
MGRKTKLFDVLCYGLIGLVFLLSFRSFATHLTPSFNSDNAIHVLMTYDLQLPDDLYYWGQERLGSAIPILGHAFLKTLPLAPVQAAALAHYFFMVVGYVCLATFLTRPLSRLTFALVWFLPTSFALPIVKTAQPYAPQLAFTGIAVVVLDQLLRRQHLREWQRHLLVAIATASLFLGLWVSELTMAFMIVLVALGIFLFFRATYPAFLKNDYQRINHSLFYVVTITFISGLGLTFLQYAKRSAAIELNDFARVASPEQIAAIVQGMELNYSSFNTLAQMGAILVKLAENFWTILTFQAGNGFLSIHLVLILIAIILTGWQLLKSQRNGNGLRGDRYSLLWLIVFAVHTALGFLMLVISHQTYDDATVVGARYFTFIYLTGWLATLMLVEQSPPLRAWKLQYILLAAAFFSSLTLPPYVFAWGKATPEVVKWQPVQELGEVGIIGSYQIAYVPCMVDPARLDCVQYDRRGRSPCPQSNRQRPIGRVRCPRCLLRVLDADTIYLIRDDWFEAFPEEIQQFNQCLVKDGDAITIGGHRLAPYRYR